MTTAIALALLLAAQAAAPAAQHDDDKSVAQPAQPPPSSPEAASQHRAPKICSPDSMTAPHVVFQVQPKFAKNERKPTLSATSVVQIIISTEGNAENAHILRSATAQVKPKQRADALILDQKALDAVKQYRFAPARCDGEPMAVELNVEVHFNSARIF